MSTVTITKYCTFRRTDILNHTTAKWLRTIRICSTFNLNCRLDRSFVNFLAIYVVPKKCSKKLCVHQKTSVNSWQNRLCMSATHVHKRATQSTFWKSNTSLLVMFDMGIYKFQEVQKPNKDITADVVCLSSYCATQQCVHAQTWKKMVKTHTNTWNAKRPVTLLIFFQAHRPTVKLIVADRTPCFAKKTSRYYEAEKRFPLQEKYLAESQSALPEPLQKNKNKFLHGIIMMTSHRLMKWARTVNLPSSSMISSVSIVNVQ